jgi:TonB family protein
MSSFGLKWLPAATLLGAVCAAPAQSTPSQSAADHSAPAQSAQAQSAPAQSAQAQSAPAPLPSLPSGPAPAPLVLPKTSGPVTLYSSRPGDVPPPAPLPEDEDTYCSTPTDLAYRTSKPVSAEGRRAAERYMWTVKRQIWSNWKAPRAINDPWLKGAVVRIKFEILADGSLNDPAIMMSSGRASYDRSALESIKHSAPFAPPPADGPTPFRVCYSFGYNVNREYQETMPVDVFAPKKAKP